MKERSKLTIFFHKNLQKTGHKEKLEAKAAYCTEQIMKAKNDYTLRMTNKLNDPKATSETYWSTLNRLLYSKKIPAISPLLVNGKLELNLIFLMIFCFNMCINKQWKDNATI